MKAQASANSHRNDTAERALRVPTCPACRGGVYRIPRRFVDLLTSAFVPVHRYCCRSIFCGWHGNLRTHMPNRPIGADRIEQHSYLLEPSQMGRSTTTKSSK